MPYEGLQTFAAVVAHRAAEQPERRFAKFETAELTYGELDTGATRLANALGSLGLHKGDRCAVMLPNGPDYLVTWTALSQLGIIEVPVNVAFRGDLLAYVLRQSGCRAVVVAATLAERIAAVIDAVPDLEHVVTVGDGAPAVPGAAQHRFADLLRSGDTTRVTTRVDPTDPSVILFTSGTTGPSKGAVLSHRANFRLAINTCELMGYTKGERLFTVFPLFHVNARYNTVLAALYIDGDIVMHDRFSATNFWDFCRAENVTAFNYMGALLMMLFKQPERPDDADNPVRRAYGAPAPLEIYDAFEQRFGVQIVEVYGSTELGQVTMNTIERFRKGSCGFAVPYYDVAIHDEYDEPCPPGVAGEIVVRPKEPSVMFDGYWGMPEATVASWRNLWFHTGDRGRMDEDGYFYFIDRMKDCVRRRGENISSYEVERVINDHPKVLESAVIGVASELTEEEVMAVVVPHPGQHLTPEELLDHCQPRMAHFAVPRYVRFVDELPKTPSQRVEKYKLRAVGVTPDTWDRQAVGYVVQR